ncbi:permease, partial [Lysobacter sp. D1-1-M9]
MASALRDDNRVVAGEFWPAAGTARPELSVEQGYAESLGWKIGDEVAFDVAGQRFAATITSLREVDWESFRPNFFVVASPGALTGFPASHITAVTVPQGQDRFTAELVSRFP